MEETFGYPFIVIVTRTLGGGKPKCAWEIKSSFVLLNPTIETAPFFLTKRQYCLMTSFQKG